MEKSAEEIMILRAKELGWTVEEYKQYLLNTLDQYEGFRDLQTKFARGVAEESDVKECKNLVLTGMVEGLRQEIQHERKMRHGHD